MASNRDHIEPVYSPKTEEDWDELRRQAIDDNDLDSHVHQLTNMKEYIYVDLERDVWVLTSKELSKLKLFLTRRRINEIR